MSAELRIEHDSRNPVFRFPVGAAEAGGRVRLAICVEGAESVQGQVRIWRDGFGETLLPLVPFARAREVPVTQEDEKATGEPLPSFDVPT